MSRHHQASTCVWKEKRERASSFEHVSLSAALELPSPLHLGRKFLGFSLFLEDRQCLLVGRWLAWGVSSPLVRRR
ncbi:hypothetical protein MLD38_036259 [Melastoma candidum]|uniref:Uncharacterized protein n=1 Tax=Melastoma candidum TaxID=119954 RepID=A0ACB9LJ35_9MYRT|nr:hypothetical protein MLD38_036259 [Melastoma candidum]